MVPFFHVLLNIKLDGLYMIDSLYFKIRLEYLLAWHPNGTNVSHILQKNLNKKLILTCKLILIES